MSNHIRRFKRPDYIAHRDFTPIECLPDDCLLKHYDVPLPWKDGTPRRSCRQPEGGLHESLREALRARGEGQAAARRPDRRRQVRARCTWRRCRRRRASIWSASPISRPPTRAPTWSASAGRRALRRASLDAALKRHDASRRRLAGAGRASADRHRRSRRPAIRRRRSSTRSPRSATASTWSWSRSRPTRSAARCSRARRAEAGVVYSLAYGDQPALICDLVDWARAAGFPVVAAGRGHKWLPHFAQSTPETVWGYYGLTPEQAKVGGLNPKMFNSFLDGSKPAIETHARCATRPASRPRRAAWPIRPARRRDPGADAADERRRRAAPQGPGRGHLLAASATARRFPTTSASACSSCSKARPTTSAAASRVRREDRSVRALRLPVQALAPDRPRGRHFGRLGRPARRGHRLRRPACAPMRSRPPSAT